MNLTDYMQRQKAWIERSLNEWLPDLQTPPTRLHDAMRYSVMAGGKRLRPILALATGELVDADPEKLIKPALALEIFHTYTLIHDDLPCMDDDDLRRGLPTAHKKFDEATAVLAGDALLTLSFEWLAEHSGQLVTELAMAGGHAGVIAGQVADLAAEKNPPDAQMLDYIHLNKTAALLRCSIRIGAIAGKAPQETLNALSSFGTDIGLAFQIIDDILDSTADTDTLGKPAGSDQEQGKTTYVDVYGIDGARERATAMYQRAMATLREVDGDTTTLEHLAQFICDRDH